MGGGNGGRGDGDGDVDGDGDGDGTEGWGRRWDGRVGERRSALGTGRGVRTLKHSIIVCVSS